MHWLQGLLATLDFNKTPPLTLPMGNLFVSCTYRVPYDRKNQLFYFYEPEFIHFYLYTPSRQGKFCVLRSYSLSQLVRQTEQVLGTVQFCLFKNLFFLRCDKYRIPWVTRQTPCQLLLHSQHFTQSLNTPSHRQTHPHTHSQAPDSPFPIAQGEICPPRLRSLAERKLLEAGFSCVFCVTLPAVYPKAESPLWCSERALITLHRGDYFIP